MKIYGSISRLVSVLFRKDSQDITLRPNQATTYTAARDLQLPPGDTAHVLLSATSTATLTNKTFDADGSGNSITNIENADIKAGAAIDAAKIANGSVSNTEFQYLDGVTSAIQTQLGAKASTALDNLASVAINTTLVSDTDNTDDLGTASKGWKEGFINKLSLDSNSQTTSVQGSASASASVTYSLPVADGSSGFVLATNGSGALSWVSNASSSSFIGTWLLADGASKTLTHNLGTTNVHVEIYDTVDGSTLLVNTVIRTDANTLDLTSSEAPAVAWTVVITAA